MDASTARFVDKAGGQPAVYGNRERCIDRRVFDTLDARRGISESHLDYRVERSSPWHLRVRTVQLRSAAPGERRLANITRSAPPRKYGPPQRADRRRAGPVQVGRYRAGRDLVPTALLGPGGLRCIGQIGEAIVVVGRQRFGDCCSDQSSFARGV